MLAVADAGALWHEIVVPSERAWLVRLCARLSGNAEAAEDLAQETLLEAWRHRWKLHDPRGRLSWLAAIAHHVCSRWRHDQARHQTRNVDVANGIEIDAPLEDFDLEVELERHELADILDRAMALLPPDTRTVLIERFVQESTHAEIAEQLHLSEGTVRVRLHRGKQALKRVLTEHFTEDAAAYGFGAPDPVPWEPTRVWCPLCGNRRLIIRVNHALGTVTSRCDDCCQEPDDSITDTEDRAVTASLKSYKAIISRQLSLAARWHERLSGERSACARCGDPAAVEVVVQRERGLRPCRYGWVVRCRTCQNTSFVAAHGLALTLPDTQRFWRQHPRMHALAEREVEVSGTQALVVPFASAPGNARLDVVAALSDFRVLGIHETAAKVGVSILNDA